MVRPHDRARQGIHKGAMQDHDLMTGPLDSRRRPGQQPFSLVGQSRVSQVAEDVDHLLDSLISVPDCKMCTLPAGVLSWITDRPENVHCGMMPIGVSDKIYRMAGSS